MATWASLAAAQQLRNNPDAAALSMKRGSEDMSDVDSGGGTASASS